jgi:hypothetical protein
MMRQTALDWRSPEVEGRFEISDHANEVASIPLGNCTSRLVVDSWIGPLTT